MLGYALPVFCKTLSFLYPSSHLEVVTQTFICLSVLFASALVVLRVYAKGSPVVLSVK
jgi:hypothetical protein